MGCKEHHFSFIVSGKEIEELVAAFFHTILFHRILPALDFREGSVSYNSYLGTRDVDCDYLALTYVCINSDKLISQVSGPIRSFAESMLSDAGSQREASGSISLEFAVHRKGTWGLSSEPSVWERWIIGVILRPLEPKTSDKHREQLSGQVCGSLLSILEILNSPPSHMPSLGSSQSETEHVIEFSIPNISPYRFNITYNTSSSQQRTSVGSAARRFLKHT